MNYFPIPEARVIWFLVRSMAWLVCVNSVVQALPFAPPVYNEGLGSGGQRRVLGANMHGDTKPEIYSGSDKIAEAWKNTFVSYLLPHFDFSPYAPNFPVTWENGFGDLGDVDNDGDIDIVRSAVLYYNGKAEKRWRMMTCLNEGSGNFKATWQWSADNLFANAEQEIVIRLADLDLDGDLDLIEGSSGLRVRWNPGDGNFSANPQQVLPANEILSDVAIVDLNRDGWLDLVAATQSSSGAKLWRVLNYEGKFTVHHEMTLSNNKRFLQLAVADMDEDGRPDIVASYYSYYFGPPNGSGFGLIMWYRNTGVDLESGIPIAAVGNDCFIDSFALGDLDEDGRDDLVYGIKKKEGVMGTTDVMLALRQEGPNFAVPVRICDNAGPLHEASALGLIDIDKDGDLDVVYGGGAWLLENISVHRTSLARAVAWGGTSPSGAVDVITTDLNGDGHEELVVASEGNKRIFSYSTGNGTLSGPITISTGGRTPVAVTSADFNRDGYMDLAYLSGNELRTLISYNGGGLVFTDTVVGTMAGVTCLLAQDGDMDGDVDLLAASPNSGAIRWYLNPGIEGAFWTLQSVTNAMSGVRAIAVGQLIAGGRPEVAASAPGTPLARFFQHNGTAWVAKGEASDLTKGLSNAVLIADLEGKQGFEWLTATGGNWIHLIKGGIKINNSSHSINSLESIDWNGDGKTDILCAHEGGVTLFLNSVVAPDKWTSYQLASQTSYQKAVPIDLNRDGLMDAVGVTSTGQLMLFLNESAQATLTNQAMIPDDQSLVLSAGGAAEIINLNIKNHGISSIIDASFTKKDAAIIPDVFALRFSRADPMPDGSWKPGNLLSHAELSKVIDEVAVNGISMPIPAGPWKGSYLFALPMAERVNLATSPNSLRNLRIRIRLKTSALQAGYERFFVEHSGGNAPISTTWVAYSSKWSTHLPRVQVAQSLQSARALIQITNLTPLQYWRQQHFGSPSNSGTAANDYDYDRDGLPNLLEYVGGTDPKVAETGADGNPVISVMSGDNLSAGPRCRIYLPHGSAADAHVRLTLEFSTTLKNWTPQASRKGGGVWSPGPQITSPLPYGIAYEFPSPSNEPGFWRLVAEELP